MYGLSDMSRLWIFPLSALLKSLFFSIVTLPLTLSSGLCLHGARWLQLHQTLLLIQHCPKLPEERISFLLSFKREESFPK